MKVLAASAAEEEPVTLTYVATEFAKMAGRLFVGLIVIIANSMTADSHA